MLLKKLARVHDEHAGTHPPAPATGADLLEPEAVWTTLALGILCLTVGNGVLSPLRPLRAVVLR